MSFWLNWRKCSSLFYSFFCIILRFFFLIIFYCKQQRYVQIQHLRFRQILFLSEAILFDLAAWNSSLRNFVLLSGVKPVKTKITASEHNEIVTVALHFSENFCVKDNSSSRKCHCKVDCYGFAFDFLFFGFLFYFSFVFFVFLFFVFYIILLFIYILVCGELLVTCWWVAAAVMKNWRAINHR